MKRTWWLALVFLIATGCQRSEQAPVSYTGDGRDGSLPVSAERRASAERPAAARKNGHPPAKANGHSAPSLSAIVNEELKNLPTGRILPWMPDPMKTGVTSRVLARIEKEFSEELFRGLERRGVQPEPLKVGTFMAVRLTGPTDAFTIEPTSSEEQVVEDRGVTQWSWNVTPKVWGTHPLTMTATVRIKLPGGGEERKDYEVFRKDVRVRVDPLGIARSALSFLFVDKWEWTFGVLFGSGGLWTVFKVRRRRRSR